VIRTLPVLLCIATAASLSAGCASDGTAALPGATPRYDAAFGESVRQARALQTLNPEAGQHGDPVLGIDGRAGASAVERYQESFKTPPRTFEVLNIGGSTVGAGQ
jgi:hypothetical protein